LLPWHHGVARQDGADTASMARDWPDPRSLCPCCRFEASGMTIANEWLWVVFDNLHALGEPLSH
jgi:hypothetical protein